MRQTAGVSERRRGRIRFLALAAKAAGIALALCMAKEAPAKAAVGDTFTDNSISYRVVTESGSKREAEVISGSEKYSGTVIIPQTVSYDGKSYRVTGVGEKAFQECRELTGISLPDSLTYIGEWAFDCCTKLPEITIPKGVTGVGEKAFYWCTALQSVTLPDSLTSIGEGAFYSCTSLSAIELPAQVTSIGKWAFGKCNALSEIELPEGLTSLNNMFQDSGLVSIRIPEGVISLGEDEFSGCKKLESVALPATLTTIGKRAFESCTALQTISLENVTTIGGYAFRYSGLTELTIPRGVTSLGWNAFDSCQSLRSVTIESGLTELDEETFSGCSALESVALPDTLTAIRKKAFYSAGSALAEDQALVIRCGRMEAPTLVGYVFQGCHDAVRLYVPEGATGYTTAQGWPVNGSQERPDYEVDEDGTLTKYSGIGREVVIPDEVDGRSIVAIGEGAFKECQTLRSVQMPSAVTSVGAGAFQGCVKLTSVTFSPKITEIAADTFAGCTSLTAITLPTSVRRIGERAFQGCTALTTVTLLEAVELTDIGDSAFRGCTSLTTVTLPAAVALTDIGAKAFYGCASLTAVTLPEKVSRIGDSAFQGCAALSTVTFPASVTDIGADVFRSCEGLQSAVLSAGMTKTGAGMFRDCKALATVTLPESLEGIGDSAFYDCAALSAITLPGHLTSIGERAFQGCTALTAVTLPESLTDAGLYAFFGCNSLTEITLPKNLTNMGDAVFNNCKALTSATLSEGLTATGKNVFDGCTALTDITLPESLERIDDFAFDTCKALKTIRIPEGVTHIGNGAFSYCESLSGVTLPAGLTSLGADAFSYCSALERIVIPEGVTKIEKYLFQYCDMLADVTLPKSVTSIGERAFHAAGKGLSEAQTLMIRCGALTAPTVANNAFWECHTPAALIVPEGATGYTKSKYWPADAGSAVGKFVVDADGTLIAYNGFDTVVEIPDEVDGVAVTAVGARAFLYRTEIEKVVVPEGVMRIGESAFRGCSALADVVLPATLTSIGDDAFRGLGDGAQIVMGSVAAPALGESVFAGCENLLVNIPEHATGYDTGAWSGVPTGHHTHVPVIVRGDREASCTAYGERAYYQCEECKRYFRDADAAQGITMPIAQWLDTEGEGKIAMLPHTGGEATAAHGKLCEVCGTEYTAPLQAVQVTAPTVSERVYHPAGKVSDSALTGGSAAGADGAAVSGSWSWKASEADKVPVVDNEGYVAVFTPQGDDAQVYAPAEAVVTMTVTPAEPYPDGTPTVSAITYGEQVADAKITGVDVYYSKSDSAAVPGNFAWSAEDAQKAPAVADSGKTTYQLLFVPQDPVNYKTLVFPVTITVKRRQNAPNMPESEMRVDKAKETTGDVALPDGWAWEDTTTHLPIGTPVEALANYIGEGRDNYSTLAVWITLTRSDCEHPDIKEEQMAPDCETDGWYRKTCTVCDVVTEYTILPATGHTGGEATCTAKAVCDVCGKAYGSLDADNHASLQKVDAVEVTCTTDGAVSYYACECGRNFKDAAGAGEITEDIDAWKKIPAKGHQMTKTDGADADCTTAGAREYWTCSVCKKHFEDADGAGEISGDVGAWKVIAPLGHDLTKTDGKAADCTKDGSKTYYTCERAACGRYFEDADGANEITDSLDEWKVIPATGHTFSQEWTCNEIQHWHAATCDHPWEKADTAEHDYDDKKICKVCQYDSFLGYHVHTLEKIEGYPATCTTPGRKTYYKCTNSCEAMFVDENLAERILDNLEKWRFIPATGHAFDTKWTYDETNHWHSATCAHTSEKQDAAAHTFDANNVCTTCGYKKTPAHTHTGGEATCNKKAVCTACGAEYGEFDLTKHTGAKVAAVKETCTTDGSKEYYKCSACGKCYEDAACTKEIEGVETWKVVPAGHTGAKVAAVQATCTTAGSKEYYKCSACGKNYEDAACTKEIANVDSWKVVSATGHTASKVAAVAATCTTAGSKEYYKCSACGKNYEDAACTKEIANVDSWKVVPATGHAFDTKWTYDETNHWHSATCAHTSEKQGVAAHTFDANNVCTTCGYKKATAHTHAGTKVDGKPATCTTDGTKEYYTCDCGKYFEDAACTKEITESIDVWKVLKATGHSETDVACVPATMKTDGVTAGKKCATCGEILSGCETIYSAKTVALAQSTFVCDGKAKTPKMNVKDSKGNTIAPANYTVKLAAGRKDVGKYKVELNFTGNYSGSKSLSFTIVPKGTSVSKVTADKKSLKITLKKQTKQTTGYEVQVTTDKNFKKNIKKATVKDPKKNTVTIKSLKSNTKYYIRVRTYKTVKGKKYYSDWKKYNKVVTTKK